MTSRGKEGKNQWVEGPMAETNEIRSVGVNWMSAHNESVQFPKECQIQFE